MITITVKDLTGVRYSIRSDGVLGIVEGGILGAIIPGCEDPQALETVGLGDGWYASFNPFAERDEHLNPTASLLAGQTLHGTVVLHR